MFLTVVLVIVAIWCLVTFLDWKKNVYDPIKKLPGFGYPIIGGLHMLIGLAREDILKSMNDIGFKYGPLHRSWNGLSLVLHTYKPECIETITNNTVHIDKGYVYDAFRPWLGESLLLSTESKWHRQRKLITPTFHFKILENFLEVFAEKTEILLKNLDARADGKAFDIYPAVSHCALDIICETAMGVKIDAMSNVDNDYIKAVFEISRLILWRMMRPFVTNSTYKFFPEKREADKVLDILHGFTRKVIAERRELLKNKPREKSKENLIDDEVLGKKKRTSFLDLVLEISEDGKSFSDNEIREEVDTMMFAGHDTTTTSMCWTLLLLANYPEVQEKAYEEIHGFLGDKNTPSSISELNDLKYLDCVIKESLRMYPSVPIIMRKLKRQAEIDGYQVAAGTQVMINIYQLHNYPEYYPEPEKFLPERFFPENSSKRHPYAYIPFSAGPRNCLGQKFAMFEEKTILASIINRYKITPFQSQKEAIIVPDVVLRSMNGIIVGLQKRR